MISPELQSPVDLELMEDIYHAQEIITGPDSPVLRTQLMRDDVLSERYEADIWYGSERHQPTGAYKIRGVYNAFHNLTPEERQLEVVTASEGNHGRAVAFVTSRYGVNSRVFMRKGTPEQKVQGVITDGGETTQIILAGTTYDESKAIAREYCRTTGAVYIDAFDSRVVVAGQGTWGLEAAGRLPDVDMLFSPIGGCGLLAGFATAFKYHNPEAEVIGVEPEGAASMQAAIDNGGPTKLASIDTFVDGAAVQKVGDIPYAIARPLLSQLLTVSNTDLRRATTDLRERGLDVELAAALSRDGVEQLGPTLAGKRVLYLLTGGNLSQERYEKEVRLAA